MDTEIIYVDHCELRDATEILAVCERPFVEIRTFSYMGEKYIASTHVFLLTSLVKN